ncbi:putative membrane protein [Flammeovirga yaeyamensis]|nr:putative membrane protein [Flammeovirga yaeyamensis]
MSFMIKYSTNATQPLVQKKNLWVLMYYILFGIFIFSFITWVVVCITVNKLLPQYLVFLCIGFPIYFINKKIDLLEKEINNLENGTSL